MLDLASMKNILIVNSVSDNGKLVGKVMWGAWAVASYFKTVIPGSDVIYLDENNEDNFFEKFKKALIDCDTVGFSLTSPQIKYSLPLIKYIKENYPKIKIIIGGIHPVLFPDQDYGKEIDLVVDYDLPKDFFLYELLPQKVKDSFKNGRAEVVTGFNCSFKCTFCVNSVRNCHYEPVSLEKIKFNIDYVVKNFKPKKIYFRDEDFFQDINKAKAIVNYIIEQGYHIRWEALSRVSHFRPGMIDDDFLKKMVQAGISQIRFGIESGSEKILTYLKKWQSVEQIKFAVKQCVKYNISANCSMIIGLPGETEEDREKTYELITELSGYGPLVEILGPQIYRPYPGGLLYEEVKKYNWHFPDKFKDWAGYFDNNPIGSVLDTRINYPWLTKKLNKTLPNVWILAHYGLNYSHSDNNLKKAIGKWFSWHWRRRWLGGLDLKLFIILRKLAIRKKIMDEA
jgi:radical SAM superfamily enzyme YgiQ (UPF0313 family)